MKRALFYANLAFTTAGIVVCFFDLAVGVAILCLGASIIALFSGIFKMHRSIGNATRGGSDYDDDYDDDDDDYDDYDDDDNDD